MRRFSRPGRGLVWSLLLSAAYLLIPGSGQAINSAAVSAGYCGKIKLIAIRPQSYPTTDLTPVTNLSGGEIRIDPAGTRQVNAASASFSIPGDQNRYVIRLNPLSGFPLQKVGSRGGTTFVTNAAEMQQWANAHLVLSISTYTSGSSSPAVKNYPITLSGDPIGYVGYSVGSNIFEIETETKDEPIEGAYFWTDNMHPCSPADAVPVKPAIAN